MSTTIDPAVIRRLADMHAVYRLFDGAGRLLYIGMSGRAGRRFDEHSMKNWWPLVSMITLEWHDTAAAALLAEKRAIAAERPRYNVAGSPVARRAQRSEPPASRRTGILADVLKAIGPAKGLPWQIIAERTGVPKDVVSAQCRALGVPSVDVKIDGKALKGCRRADVIAAADFRSRQRDLA